VAEADVEDESAWAESDTNTCYIAQGTGTEYVKNILKVKLKVLRSMPEAT
jgi:hypothetical protein